MSLWFYRTGLAYQRIILHIGNWWTIGKKLPQDAINPAHGSLTPQITDISFLLISRSFIVNKRVFQILSDKDDDPRSYRRVKVIPNV